MLDQFTTYGSQRDRPIVFWKVLRSFFMQCEYVRRTPVRWYHSGGQRLVKDERENCSDLVTQLLQYTGWGVGKRRVCGGCGGAGVVWCFLYCGLFSRYAGLGLRV